MHRVLDAYESSRLAQFHRRFYATPPGRPDQFETLAGSRQWRSFPTASSVLLLEPNDRLLQPAVIQHVTRALMAEGLAPREIADIVQSRYAADFNWGDRWISRDARTRAEFDVRVFAGLLVAGIDRGLDFNCRSAQEKGSVQERPVDAICAWPGSGCCGRWCHDLPVRGLDRRLHGLGRCPKSSTICTRRT